MRFSKEIRRLFRAAKVTRFPVGLSEIQQIIKHFGWEIYSYSEASDIIENCGLKEMAENNDSFVTNVGNRIVIFL